MSVKVMAWIWDQDMPKNLKFVLLAYSDHAKHDGTSIFPAYQTIAEMTGYSRRQIITITQKLEDSGWLILDGEGPHGTNRWRIPLPEMWGGEAIAPLDVVGVKSVRAGGEISAPGGEAAISPDP
jgi:hypothetical protein